MSLYYDEVYNYIDSINDIDTDNDIVICPSNIYLEAFVNNSQWSIGAQDMHYAIDEEHTGDISSGQLKSLGVEYVMVGHYEKRDSASVVNQKLIAALDSNIFPILCFGENIDEDYRDVLPKMLDDYLKDIDNISFIIFAYEPIYAIGTGAVPSTLKIREVSSYIKDYLRDKYGTIPVLIYGGSVDSSNVRDIIDIDILNGVMIGNISSDSREVDKIINCV